MLPVGGLQPFQAAPVLIGREEQLPPKVGFQLVNYSIHSVTEGEDAQGEVVVKLRQGICPSIHPKQRASSRASPALRVFGPPALPNNSQTPQRPKKTASGTPRTRW